MLQKLKQIHKVKNWQSVWGYNQSKNCWVQKSTLLTDGISLTFQKALFKGISVKHKQGDVKDWLLQNSDYNIHKSGKTRQFLFKYQRLEYFRLSMLRWTKR